ncbi:MAG: hypothetical protein QXK93_02905 [Candidatus Bathyarchaeia archaeon]
MNKSRVIIALFACLSLLLASTYTVKTQTQLDDTETFFDSKISCVRLQVNATSRAKPPDNISVILSLTSLVTKVYVKTINLTIYGFVNGTEKIEIYSNASGKLVLSKDSTVAFPHQVFVQENVYGVIYGEIYLEYDATVKDELGRELPYPFQGTIGFVLTRVENVYLESLEEELESLKEQLQSLGDQLNSTQTMLEELQNELSELNRTFTECFGKNLTREELLNINQTLWQLQNDYESLKGVKSELDGTRTAIIFLAVVAVFFVATTLYLVLRKPKSYL